MLIGENSESGYRASYAWYRVVGEEGKGVPRFFDHLDIDRDGEDEVLLEIFGVNSRWFAVLNRDGSDFRLALEDSCGA